MKRTGAIFDLDGVLVDTAKYHYLAWKRLADELEFDFTVEQNEALKGVSRMSSLDILLRIGGLSLPLEEKERLAAKKNKWYVEFLMNLDESALLGNVKEVLETLRGAGIKIALGSASKNSGLILERTGIIGLFDAIVDGNCTTKAKPDPEVFVLAATKLGLTSADCVVFEDAISGIEAAKAAGMFAVGIGSGEVLKNADMLFPSVDCINSKLASGIFNVEMD